MLFILLVIFFVSGLLPPIASPPTYAGSVKTGTIDPESDEDTNGNALTFVGSSTPNGARYVPLNPLIQLNFNKNIVNFSVARENALCYHLVDQENHSVPIKIIMPDDQMQDAVKRCVFITPEEELLPDTIYTLAIDHTLMAKNGDLIDDAHVITFKTGTETRNKANPLLESLGINILTFSSDLPMNENSVPGSSQNSPASYRPPGYKRLSINDIDIALVSRVTLAISVIALALITLVRLRKKQSAP
jgi:hypothetical protein